jgi:hypothetical protein
VAEGAPLLREYRVYSSIEGSNPSRSASFNKTPATHRVVGVLLCAAIWLSSNMPEFGARVDWRSADWCEGRCRVFDACPACLLLSRIEGMWRACTCARAGARTDAARACGVAGLSSAAGAVCSQVAPSSWQLVWFVRSHQGAHGCVCGVRGGLGAVQGCDCWGWVWRAVRCGRGSVMPAAVHAVRMLHANRR